MIPKANVSNAASTSAITSPTLAVSHANVMGIASVGATGVQPETGLVEISITTGKEYHLGTFGNRACYPRSNLDGNWPEFCSLTVNGNHRHEIKTKRDCQLADNPIPLGAVRLFESSVYVDSAEPLAQDYCLIEQTSSAFIKKSGPACLVGLDNQDQTTETCSVVAGLHVHTKKKQITMPRLESPIPKGALSFYQDYNYVSNEEQYDVESYPFDPNDPPNEPGYSHRFVANKLSEEKTSFSDWQIPHGWDPLPKSVREKYLNDIINCYKKGASSQALSKYHHMNIRSINGLILLKLSRKEMMQIRVENKLNLEWGYTQNTASCFSDACEFEKTLGMLLKERVRNRKYHAIQNQKQAAKKAKLRRETTPTVAVPVLPEKSHQDASLPPKKRLSFRSF